MSQEETFNAPIQGKLFKAFLVRPPVAVVKKQWRNCYGCKNGGKIGEELLSRENSKYPLLFIRK